MDTCRVSDPCQKAGSNRKLIVVVEDDALNAEMLSLLLQSETSYSVWTFASPNALLQSLDEVRAMQPVLFVLDYYLPLMTALQLHDALHEREEFSAIPTVILTAAGFEEAAYHVGQRNIRVCSKPFEVDEFLSTLEEVIAAGSSKALFEGC